MVLREFKKNLFDKAQEVGFEQYELYYVKKEDTTITVSEGEIDSHEISGSNSICFRGLINGKMGYAYTEKFDELAVEMLVETAKECAFLVEKEDREFIYKGQSEYKNVDVYDENIVQLDTNTHQQMTLELEEKAKALDARIVKIEESCVATQSEEVIICNSEGLDLTSKQTYISAYVAPIAKDEEGMIDGFKVKTVNSLDKLSTDEIAKKAVSNTLRKIGATSIPSGKYKVVFENSMGSALLRVMQSSFFADVMQEGKSLLKGKRGEHIASNKVNLIDNPFVFGGIGNRGFDDEGVPTKEKYLIKNGEFIDFLHNLKTAYKEGVETTGNGMKGSISAPVRVASTNLYIDKGEVSLDELLVKAQNGLYITELAGIHAGANSVTGDFSLAARGLMIENGKLTKGIKQITIAGNFFNLLKDIEEIANDLEFRGSIGSPSLLIKEISVAGE